MTLASEKVTAILNSELNSLTPVKTTESPNKKEILLYFWATWCPDCKEKLTSVFKEEKLFAKYNVYLISTDKDLEKVAHFQNKNSLMPYVYIDLKKDLQRKLNIFSVPTIVKLARTNNEITVLNTQTGGDISDFIK